MSRVLALFLVCAAAAASAQVPSTCDAPREVDKYQLLRRLSLDLRGHAPTYDEYVALDTQSSVPASTVQSYLATDEFRQVMRRYHEELFWPNLSSAALAAVNSQLVVLVAPDAWALSSTTRRRIYRGATDVQTTLGAQCGDFEQTDLLQPGARPNPASIRSTVVNGVTVKQEGWRWVTPYWDPGARIKVCAFDAQETPTVTLSGKVWSCGAAEANGAVDCGCGPNLEWCYGPAAVRTAIQASMREQLLRMVDRVSTGGQPYTELLLSRMAPVNGPLVFWKKNLAPNYSLARIYALPDPNEPLPALDFTASTTWQDVDRGSDLHAGVLTAPGYLLRFQTNRGRANRFRIDFECEAFEPPSQLETPAQGCSVTTGDLTQKCTCRYCHRQLEPLAAHWGQFSEAGTTLMTDTTAYPRAKASCVGSTSGFCQRFYVTNDQADNPGALLPFQYADTNHADITASLTGGPRARAQEIVSNGTFAKCTVKRTWAWLLKRDMRVSGAETEELPALDRLSTGFAAHGYALPWLVQQIVSQPEYRRAR